jgi:hypothetical protein
MKIDWIINDATINGELKNILKVNDFVAIRFHNYFKLPVLGLVKHEYDDSGNITGVCFENAEGERYPEKDVAFYCVFEN